MSRRKISAYQQQTRKFEARDEQRYARVASVPYMSESQQRSYFRKLADEQRGQPAVKRLKGASIYEFIRALPRGTH